MREESNELGGCPYLDRADTKRAASQPIGRPCQTEVVGVLSRNLADNFCKRNELHMESGGLRYSEIRLLRWGQIDLKSCTLTVGLSKTESGTGRMLPLNDRAIAILGFWASLFPGRELDHYVFASERYGASGDGRTVVYDCDPTKPIGRWKEAWKSAKSRSGVSCRFHDLRHTGCTRMLEAGVPFSVVATIMGWSPSTTVRMSRRYGHIGQASQRHAVNALNLAGILDDGAQKWAQSQKPRLPQLPN